MNLQSDTVKAVFTYTIALLLVVGGLLFLYFSRLDPDTSNTRSLVPLVAGFIGAAIQFVFNRETQTQTARQVERGIAQGTAGSPTA